jgi:O-antigen/teichoic acid export membrane protein
MPIPRLSNGVKTLRTTSVLHNISGAAGIQLSLLVSGILSARLLGPQGRGYYAILSVIPSAVGQLGAVGMSLAATYYLSSGAIAGSELIQLLRRPAFVQLTLLTLINSAIVLGYVFISGAPIILAACVSLVALPAAICADYGIAFLLGARRHGAANVVRTLNPALTAAGIAVLFIFSDRSVAAVMAVSVGASVVIGGITLQKGVLAALAVKVTNSLVVKLGSRRAKRKILAFGRQGYIGYLSPVETFGLDQLAVGFLLSPRELGLYVVGAAFTNVAKLVARNVGLSATADIAAQTDPDTQRRAVRHTLLIAAGALTLVTVALAGFVVVAIPLFFGNRYRASIPMAEVLLVASGLLAMKRIVVDVMRGLGETRAGTAAEIVNLTLFLSFAAPLGLWLGGKGVALALALAAAGGSTILVKRLRGGIFVGASASLEPALPSLSRPLEPQPSGPVENAQQP